MRSRRRIGEKFETGGETLVLGAIFNFCFGFCEAVSFHPSQANSGIIQREICDARRKSYADETGGFDAKVKPKKKNRRRARRVGLTLR